MNDKNTKLVFIPLIIFISAIIGYSLFRSFSLSADLKKIASESASTTAYFLKKTGEADNSISVLEQKITLLAEHVSTADQNIEGVAQRVGNISGTVKNLEKLSKTDPQLLQKYSKVFFLNEHYAPERLSEIDGNFVYSDKKAELINSLVLPHLKDMLESAKSVNVVIYVKSAYRSFEEQRSVKSAYSVVYGKGNANQFSADQGYSEHQLGTTVDITSDEMKGSLTGFEKSVAYLWMKLNAHKYGFVLSYPEKNGYYIFEPWHWRYVGVALASRLYEEGSHFYDLDQREIDKYLPNFFDY